MLLKVVVGEEEDAGIQDYMLSQSPVPTPSQPEAKKIGNKLKISKFHFVTHLPGLTQLCCLPRLSQTVLLKVCACRVIRTRDLSQC